MATIRFRRAASAADWLASSLILSPGEPGFALDTGELRIGNGVQTWANLPSPSAAASQWNSITGKPTTFPPSLNSITDGHVTVNANINADKLADGTTRKLLTATERTKLTGIAAGATANSTDAQLRDRSTHTGVQASSSISDFAEAVQDTVNALLVGSTGITLSYNDTANTLTITGGGSGGLDAEAVRDAIGIALIGSGYVSVVINDAADTITISGSQALTDALAAKAGISHAHAASDITSGTIPVARLTPGSSLKVIWNPTTSQWLYAGSAITARPGNRTDICLDFVGGRESDRPSWGNVAGDTHEVTITP
jgi:hypothetical protein